jgi:ribonuclease HI
MNTIMKTQLVTAFFNRAISKQNIKNSVKIYPTTEPNNFEYSLFFDGCSKGNPGPGGSGAVIYHNNVEIWSNNKFIGENVTNNVAEYNGLILGLNEAVKKDIKNIHVKGDSLLVIKQMKGEYKVKSENILHLYNQAKFLENHFDNIIYEHVYRKDNKRADELSNYGLDIKERTI